MNYFDNMTFNKGVITVLGIEADSDFVKALAEHLKQYGSVKVTEELPAQNECDYTVVVPDKNTKCRFVVHNEADIEAYKNAGIIIGMIDVKISDKKICDVVDGADKFAAASNFTSKELVYPVAIKRIVLENEKYDFLYVYNVENEGDRYTAREIARHNKHIGVKMIRTDDTFVQTLISAPKGE